MTATDPTPQTQSVECLTEERSRTQEALRSCMSAMEMQEKREQEEFHIPQSVAKRIWDEAKTKAANALKPVSDRQPEGETK